MIARIVRTSALLLHDGRDLEVFLLAGVLPRRRLTSPPSTAPYRLQPGAGAGATCLLHPGSAAYRLHPRGGGAAASCAGHLVVSVSTPATPPSISSTNSVVALPADLHHQHLAPTELTAAILLLDSK
uniref:Uncharacterized protein n=1 Tax=Oryza meridionalis TaxID=40149 RepID=A0A0E0E2C9_9ORYZ